MLDYLDWFGISYFQVALRKQRNFQSNRAGRYAAAIRDPWQCKQQQIPNKSRLDKEVTSLSNQKPNHLSWNMFEMWKANLLYC